MQSNTLHNYANKDVDIAQSISRIYALDYRGFLIRFTPGFIAYRRF